MSRTERYLTQATRGLLGEKKTEARMELRGAIEDKIWRHTLAGLNPDDAETAALRDLGSPHLVARDLHRVHTTPSVLRATLLLGVAGLLSLQAVAQGNAIRAAPDPNFSECAFTEPQLALLPPSDAEATRQALRDPARRKQLVSACLKRAPTPGNSLLRLTDLWSALRTSGVTVEPTSATGYRLNFPGRPSPALVNFSDQIQWIGGEKYVDLSVLITQVIARTDLPASDCGQRQIRHRPVGRGARRVQGLRQRCRSGPLCPVQRTAGPGEARPRGARYTSVGDTRSPHRVRTARNPGSAGPVWWPHPCHFPVWEVY